MYLWPETLSLPFISLPTFLALHPCLLRSCLDFDSFKRQKSSSGPSELFKCQAGWWFGTFFIFPYIGNNHPNWLIFFRGVQTTNQQVYAVPPASPSVFCFPCNPCTVQVDGKISKKLCHHPISSDFPICQNQQSLALIIRPRAADTECTANANVLPWAIVVDASWETIISHDGTYYMNIS